MMSISSKFPFFFLSTAFDPFEGLIQQGKPCFPLIRDGGCHSPLTKVFSPEYKGSNINDMETKLWLFTVTNPEKAEPLHMCGGSLPEDSDFDATFETIIVTHGWLDGACRTAWMREIKEQLFQRDKYNIILVDWTWGNTFDPIEASVNSIVAGEHIAFVVMNIMVE